jgi:hypothetical protein
VINTYVIAGKRDTAAPESTVRKFERTLRPGLIVRVTGVGAAATRDAFQAYLSTLPQQAPAKFVEIDNASKTAYLRFEAPEGAAAAATALQTNDANVQRAVGSDASASSVLE